MFSHLGELTSSIRKITFGLLLGTLITVTPQQAVEADSRPKQSLTSAKGFALLQSCFLFTIVAKVLLQEKFC